MRRYLLLLTFLVLLLATGCASLPLSDVQPPAPATASEAVIFNPDRDPNVCGGWTNSGSDQGVGGYGFGGRGYVIKDGKVVVDQTCPPEFWGRSASEPPAQPAPTVPTTFGTSLPLAESAYCSRRPSEELQLACITYALYGEYPVRDPQAIARARNVQRDCMMGLRGCWESVKAKRQMP